MNIFKKRPKDVTMLSAAQKKLLAVAPNTSLEDLEKLVKDPNPDVRVRVARRPGISPETLEELAKKNKDYPKVLAAVAGNSNTPPETLEELAKHPDPDVLAAVARNSNTPPGTLDELAKKNKDHPQVLVAVAFNSNTLPGTLEELAKHPNPVVRASVAENLNAPEETLETLAGDKDNDVSQTAINTMRVVRFWRNVRAAHTNIDKN